MAQLKREMLERARLIYRDEGLEALSMRRLAQDAGLSTMALYSYFPSKQALLDGLWLDVFEALLEAQLPVSIGRRAPLKVLEAHVRAFVEFWEARPDQFRMIYMSAQRTAGEAAVDMQGQPTYRKLIQLERERVAAACARDGSESSEQQVAELAATMLLKALGYLLLVLGMPRYPLPEREALRERVLRDAVRGVAQGLA